MILEVNVFLGDVNCFLNQQGSCVEVILTCSVLHPVGLTPEHMAMAALSLLITLKVTKPGTNSPVKEKQINNSIQCVYVHFSISSIITWVRRFYIYFGGIIGGILEVGY